ncbi:hypothetical protein ACFL1B_03635 [Nanoarchaeota archaeon]
MYIGKALGTLALAATMGLSGCRPGYSISQDTMGELLEDVIVADWVEMNDNYIAVLELLQAEQYEAADSLLQSILIENVASGSEFKGGIMETPLPDALKERVAKTIDAQIAEIQGAIQR